MLKKYLKEKYLIVLILIFSLFLRLYGIDYPKGYVFDEVYHAFTAKEYLRGNIESWEWWTIPPKGVAFEWTHPALAKEIMSFSMKILNSTNAWTYRFPGVIFGVISVYLVYLLSEELFKKRTISLISAFLFSIDGINFVQSRTGMNDIYMVTFSLACILAYLRKKYFLSSIFFGLAFSSKWSAVYIIGFIILLNIYILIQKRAEILSLVKKNLLKIAIVSSYFAIIPVIIYLFTYMPFFTLGHTLEQFKQLHQQMWWYHTSLKATHDYASPFWSWPLNLYPVWYFVDYKDNTIANIFNSGNPVLFWLGSLTVVLTFYEFIKTKSRTLFIVLLGFLTFWGPWALSPRIMFLYHFAPSVPFMCLMLGYQLGTNLERKTEKSIAALLIVLCFISFLAIYPFLTGIPAPKYIVNLFFYWNITKDPFN